MSDALAEIGEPKEVEYLSASALADVTRAEIDIQVATAKRYPRSVGKAVAAATTVATMNQEIAAACMYSLPRGGKMITGPSVRLAEIVASAWGNLRFGARVVGDDGRTLTVQGFAHDLETNTAFAFELKARVTNRQGQRYSDDMVVTTANAASSKALRNAVFRVVPRAIVDQIQAEARKVAVGDAKTIGARRDAAVAHFGKLGVPADRILALFGRRTVADLDAEDLFHLQGLATAIKDKEITIEAAFPEPKPEPASRTDQVAKKLPSPEAPKADQDKPAAGGLYTGTGSMESLKK